MVKFSFVVEIEKLFLEGRHNLFSRKNKELIRLKQKIFSSIESIRRNKTNWRSMKREITKKNVSGIFVLMAWKTVNHLGGQMKLQMTFCFFAWAEFIY